MCNPPPEGKRIFCSPPGEKGKNPFKKKSLPPKKPPKKKKKKNLKTSILELTDFFTKPSDLSDVVTVALSSDPLYPIALTLG